MKGRVGSRIALIVVVVALTMGAGCGSGGGGGGEDANDNQASGTTPTPTHAVDQERTPTPNPTSTPAGATPVGATPVGATPVGATPVPTATPASAGATVRVDFTITAHAALLGFQFTALYPTISGSFTDSGARVHCPLGPPGIFAKNDQDNGNLILAAANTTPLPRALTISCTFDVVAGQVLGAEDVGIAVTEVTDDSGAVGDPSTLTVTVDVS
jgi:hypothetical protein